MNTKLPLAVLLGALTYFFLGFLFYGLLFEGFMHDHVTHYEGLMKEESSTMIGYILISIFFAILITFILHKANVRGALDGLVMTAIVTFLIGISNNVMYYTGMNLYSGVSLVVDVIIFTVMGAIIGAVIGWVLGRSKSTVAAGMA